MVQGRAIHLGLRENLAGSEPVLPGVGWLAAYTEYASEITDSPPAFHHRIGLSILSTVIGRNVYLQQGYKKVFPNVWLLVVAPSSFYRKSYSLGIAENLLRATQNETRENYILPREFSQERLIEILATTPQGLMILYEFKTFMGLLSREYMSGSQAMFTELFDCPDVYDRTTRAGTSTIVSPFVNILGATTMDWFRSSIKDEDQAGGFLPRFLVVSASGRKEKTLAWQPPVDEVKKARLVSRLLEFSRLSGPCIISSEAKEAYATWYVRFESQWGNPGRLSPFYARLQEYAKKLMILKAIDETGGLTITVGHVESACRIAESFAREIKVMMEDDLIDIHPIQRKVADAIKSQRDGITREDLIRKTRVNSRHLNEVIQTLAEGELIIINIEGFTNSQGAARNRTTYVWNRRD